LKKCACCKYISGGERDIAEGNTMVACNSSKWKSLEELDFGGIALSPQKQGPRKKRECSEGGKIMGTKKNGRISNGSGMVEAVTQPRRLQ
jgi:hypothetical protein